MEGQVDSVVYRPVGSVGKLQGVQERVSDDHRGQGDRSEVVKSCGPWLLGNRDNG